MSPVSVLCAYPVSRNGSCVDRSRSDSLDHQIYAMQSIELIRQFLHERIGTDPDQVVDGALLADLGVDSLMLAELFFEAEDRLGISIESDTEIPRSVGDMVTLIEAVLVAKSAQAASS